MFGLKLRLSPFAILSCLMGRNNWELIFFILPPPPLLHTRTHVHAQTSSYFPYHILSSVTLIRSLSLSLSIFQSHFLSLILIFLYFQKLLWVLLHAKSGESLTKSRTCSTILLTKIVTCLPLYYEPPNPLRITKPNIVNA
jgi:hypothetical protein